MFLLLKIGGGPGVRTPPPSYGFDRGILLDFRDVYTVTPACTMYLPRAQLVASGLTLVLPNIFIALAD
jgi:hypothetical protein